MVGNKFSLEEGFDITYRDYLKQKEFTNENSINL